MGNAMIIRALTFPFRAAFAVSFALVMMVFKAAIGIAVLAVIIAAMFYWKG
jgi:hypothetical protein